MDGKQQSELMAKLAEPWKPDNLAGIKVHDLVDVQTLGRCEVVELLPPALLRLRNAKGAVFKVGWRQVTRV